MAKHKGGKKLKVMGAELGRKSAHKGETHRKHGGKKK